VPWFYGDNLQKLEWFVRSEKYYNITFNQGVSTFQFFSQFVYSLRLFRFLLSNLLDSLAKLAELCVLLCKHNSYQNSGLENYCKVHYVIRHTRFLLGYILELLALPIELLRFIFEFSGFLAQLLGHIF